MSSKQKLKPRMALHATLRDSDNLFMAALLFMAIGMIISAAWRS